MNRNATKARRQKVTKAKQAANAAQADRLQQPQKPNRAQQPQQPGETTQTKTLKTRPLCQAKKKQNNKTHQKPTKSMKKRNPSGCFPFIPLFGGPLDLGPLLVQLNRPLSRYKRLQALRRWHPT